jgi:hypothetical protein
MKLDGKVNLARLFERTSAAGNRYFSGRMGAARIMLFKDERADDDNVWQLFVQDSDEQPRQGAQTAQGRAQRETTAPWDAQKPATPVSGPENADTGPSLPFGEPLQ